MAVSAFLGGFMARGSDGRDKPVRRPALKAQPPDLRNGPASIPRVGLRSWVLACLIAAGVVTGYAFFWPQAPVLAPDSQSYLEAARDLGDGRLDQLHDRTLGYPLVLALTGSAEEPGRLLFLVQMVFHVMAILFLVRVARGCGVMGRRAWILTLLGGLPPAMAPAAYVLSESTCELALAVAAGALILWLLGRGGVWLWTSVLFSVLTALTRPTFQLLGIAWGLAVVCVGLRVSAQLRRRLLFGAAALGLGTVILTLGETGFNEHFFGFKGVTPLFGFNLSTRTVRYVERLPQKESTIRQVLLEHRDRALLDPGGDHTASMFIWRAIPDLQAATGLARAELSQKMVRLNLGLIAAAPLHYLSEVVRAGAIYWLPYSPSLAHSGSRWLQLLWACVGCTLLLLFGMHLVVFLGLLLLTRLGPPWAEATRSPEIRGLRAGLLVCLVAILYSSVISAVFETGDPRYRLPTEALIWLFVLLGFELWRRLGRLHGPPSGSRSAPRRPAPS